MKVEKSRAGRSNLVRVAILTLTLVAGMILPVAHAAPMAVYYVDPANGNDANNGLSTTGAFQSILQARNTVRTINMNMTGDVYIYLMAGTNWITSPISFTPADSGTGGHTIWYQAYPGASPSSAAASPSLAGHNILEIFIRPHSTVRTSCASFG